VIYSLKSGDTLLGIAGRFGISLQALEDVNGITNPTGLMVGQELIIPRAEEAQTEGTPTATATALPFVVENVTFSRTPLGGLWCFGEIHNTTGVDLEQAAVRITLLGENGKPLAEVETFAILDLIAPDGRAPFAVRFPEPPATFASYTVYPQAGVRGYLGSYYRDLVVRDTKGEGERYAAYTVSGIIANTGPEDAVGVTVTITLYDALGRVIGTRRVPPEHNVIPRGGQTTFTVQLTPAGGPVNSFKIVPLGRRILATPAAP
jgi:murein DD-endopeptidase MepM/ murein hydrolase activator NlpD